MKAIILASTLSVVYAVVVLAIFRLRTPENRAALMFKLYLGSLPIVLALFAVTPPDLGVLPARLTEDNAILEGGYMVFIYSASILGGWLQLYNLADRGLSLRILIDAKDRPGQVVDAEFVRTRYGAGKGMEWMYQKRLDDLLRLGLVRIDDERYLALTSQGLRNARLIRHLRQLFAIRPAGRQA